MRRSTIDALSAENYIFNFLSLVATLCASRGADCQQNICIESTFFLFKIYQVKRLWNFFSKIFVGQRRVHNGIGLWKTASAWP